MNATIIKTTALGQLRCKTFGHHFVIKQKVTDSVSEYCCTHCKEEFTTNSQGKLERLTNKTREINECLRDFFIRRSKYRLPNVTH